jgi:hypothetical protein
VWKKNNRIKMISIVNKDNELIKKYLDVQKELIEELKKINTVYSNNWLTKMEFDLLYVYDDYITSTKLSNKTKELLDLMIIVDYDYIAYNDYSYNPESISFENADDRKNWLKNKSHQYYTLEINEIEGSLEDNYSLIENYNDGDAIFIKADSVYSNNIKIAILKYNEYR